MRIRIARRHHTRLAVISLRSQHLRQGEIEIRTCWRGAAAERISDTTGRETGSDLGRSQLSDLGKLRETATRACTEERRESKRTHCGRRELAQQALCARGMAERAQANTWDCMRLRRHTASRHSPVASAGSPGHRRQTRGVSGPACSRAKPTSLCSAGRAHDMAKGGATPGRGLGSRSVRLRRGRLQGKSTSVWLAPAQARAGQDGSSGRSTR